MPAPPAGAAAAAGTATAAPSAALLTSAARRTVDVWVGGGGRGSTGGDDGALDCGEGKEEATLATVHLSECGGKCRGKRACGQKRGHWQFKLEFKL